MPSWSAQSPNPAWHRTICWHAAAAVQSVLALSSSWKTSLNNVAFSAIFKCVRTGGWPRHWQTQTEHLYSIWVRPQVRSMTKSRSGRPKPLNISWQKVIPPRSNVFGAGFEKLLSLNTNRTTITQNTWRSCLHHCFLANRSLRNILGPDILSCLKFSRPPDQGAVLFQGVEWSDGSISHWVQCKIERSDHCRPWKRTAPKLPSGARGSFPHSDSRSMVGQNLDLLRVLSTPALDSIYQHVVFELLQNRLPSL